MNSAGDSTPCDIYTYESIEPTKRHVIDKLVADSNMKFTVADIG